MIKLLLLWLGYEIVRPKAIWLWHYLIRKGSEL